MSGRLCHLCRAGLDDAYLEAGGLFWCPDTIECNFRARMRLGVGYARSLQAKATDLHTEGYSTERRAERIAAMPPPMRDEDYVAYMHSVDWEQFADEQRLMAQFNCEWCKTASVFGLDVHHLHYRTFTRERPEDVLVVCPFPCHQELDRIRKAKKLPPVEIHIELGGKPHRIATRTDIDAGDDRQERSAT